MAEGRLFVRVCHAAAVAAVQENCDCRPCAVVPKRKSCHTLPQSLHIKFTAILCSQCRRLPLNYTRFFINILSMTVIVVFVFLYSCGCVS